MYFNCFAKVEINGQTLQTVVSVDTSNDGNQIGSYCNVVVPQSCRITYNGNTNDTPANNFPDPKIDYSQSSRGFLVGDAKQLFNTGDYISIRAKYKGFESKAKAYLKDNVITVDGYVPIFEGFLYDFYETTPLKIKCLDYIYWFNIGVWGDKEKGVSYPKTTFKKLLKDLVTHVNSTITDWNSKNSTNFAEVTLDKDNFDMDLVNISFVNLSPAACLEYFKKEMGLNITFYGKVLYINLASFTKGEVKLQTDKNVLLSGLQTTNLQNLKNKKTANSIFQRFKVKAHFFKIDGTKDEFEIGDPNGQLKEVYFFMVEKGSDTVYQGKTVPKNYLELAQGALTKFRFDRYTGEVSTYLYPYYDLFWKVTYIDVRYPERNGNYVITAIKHTLDSNGFHKKIKLAFLDGEILI